MSVAAQPRRRRLALLPLGLLAALALLQLPAQAGGKPKPVRPNIIVVMTDDQTVEDLRAMPNVLRLFGEQGTTFDDNVVSYSLCCPSRATFLTGQYSHNTGVTGNSVATGLSQFKDSNTLPVWLTKAGYATIMIGKYLNEYLRVEPHRVPPGWETWYGGLRLAYYNWTLNHNGKEVSYGS